MGTSVGHGATAQILHQVFQFPSRERVVGFDGVPANSFGNGLLAQAQRVDFLADCFQLVR